jgi:hypothetical protein
MYDEMHEEISACSHIREGPLNKRGWVLQESVLSPRTVHFTESQVYRECLECFHSENSLVSMTGPDQINWISSPALKHSTW